MLQEIANAQAIEIGKRAGLPVPEFVALAFSSKGNEEKAGISSKGKTQLKKVLLVTPNGDIHGDDTLEVVDRRKETVYLGDRYEDGEDNYAHELAHAFVNTYNLILNHLFRRLQNRMLVQIPLIEQSNNGNAVARLLWQMVGIQFVYTTWQETVATFTGRTFSNTPTLESLDKLQRVMGNSLISLHEEKKKVTDAIILLYKTTTHQEAWEISQHLVLETLKLVKDETGWIMGYALGTFLAQECPTIHLGALIQANPYRIIERELVDYILNNRSKEDYIAYLYSVLQPAQRDS